MLNSVLLQPAYVLHTRAYRDTSLLLELLTKDYGRVSAVARGARGNKSRLKGLLQPFVPLLVSWRGRGELFTLHTAEAYGIAHRLTRDILVCGIYLNELLVRLFHRYDAHPNLYDAYRETLMRLQIGETQLALRLFEKYLLMELGYALQLERETETNQAVLPEQFYYFFPTQGLTRCDNHTSQPNVFFGESLLALHKEELQEAVYLRDAKRLLRIAINHLLGDKPLRSRELFL